MSKQTRNVIAASLILVVIAITSWSLTRPATAKVSAPAAVPLRVVNVVQEDVPRFVTGIGTVLSLHSVIIRPQVDGILTKVMVKEGQLVKEGDLLATIDDRSIRAALDQAKAQLGQNQAQLDVAQVNLTRYKLLSVDDGVSKQTYDQQPGLGQSAQANGESNRRLDQCPQGSLPLPPDPLAGKRPFGIRNVDEGN